jgi:hypothetical protein
MGIGKCSAHSRLRLTTGQFSLELCTTYTCFNTKPKLHATVMINKQAHIPAINVKQSSVFSKKKDISDLSEKYGSQSS